MAALGTTDEGTVALLRAHTLNCAGDSLVKEDAGAEGSPQGPPYGDVTNLGRGLPCGGAGSGDGRATPRALGTAWPSC